MKAGVIGSVDGSFQRIDAYSETYEEDGEELTRSLDVERVFSLPSGHLAFEGQAAEEYLTTQSEPRIDGGEIEVVETADVATSHTRFAGVSGEFVVADHSGGTFAFDLIAAETDTAITRPDLDLSAFLDRQDGAAPWKAGFYDYDGPADNGVLHGRDLLADESLASLIRGSGLNQLGLEYAVDGTDLKMTATESGYVEVYQPSDFDTEDFLQYLRSELVPHLS